MKVTEAISRNRIIAQLAKAIYHRVKMKARMAGQNKRAVSEIHLLITMVIEN